MRRLAIALAALTSLAGAPGAALAQEGGRPIQITLTGAAEKPNPGDPDGTGVAMLRVNPGQSQICYELKVSGIAPATAAHIHKAPPESAGGVVAPLSAPTSGASSGCAQVTRELALDIVQNPANYYVNIHNSEFPPGALRGQLGK